MHLSFASVDELDAFLNWARNYGERLQEFGSALVGIAAAGEVAFDTPPAAETASTVPPPETPHPGDSQVEQAARRKRRTKAEIEADNKAAADAEQAKAQGSQDAGEASLEAARAALRDKEPAPAGTNPFDTAPPPDHAAPAAATGAPPDAIADTTVTPFQHLTRAREFIAKHGLPKYNESFAKAGLDANVMAYTAEQRALHLDALAALEGA